MSRPPDLEADQMGKIVTGLFTSLDGIVDADDDWQFPYFDEELFARVLAGWRSAATLLLGRHSYEGYERLRVEHPDSPMLAFLDATPTCVVSSTLTHARRDGVTIIGGDPERIAQLRAESEGNVLVLGSPTLVRWLLANDLLDELNVTVLPIVVGEGPRLFDDMPTQRLALRLTGSEALRSGALELQYAPTTR
ncbi:dihydrofolate reductase family protein [Pseudonocardia sp. MH-G8]|uniref:dihydrofolate reductase family protein n=1 Tax=Pseudonocardia sp. MH-G8 TaxID=1854588 RepID=UPI001304746D|nr:dihydrofolate reductase family protein [Pseudonocardia sp. MH-G8]